MPKKKLEDRKRIQVTLNSDLYEKIAEIAERYGIATNAFIVFVLGQWTDQNYEQQKVMSEMVDRFLTSKDDVLNNPQLLEMVKEILKEDKEFKKEVSKEIKGGY